MAGEKSGSLTEVLDRDAVSRVRRLGSVGLNRMWAQLEAEGKGLELPMYGGALLPFRVSALEASQASDAAQQSSSRSGARRD